MATGALLERNVSPAWRHGSMFRPLYLLRPSISSLENHSQITPRGIKHNFKDYPSTQSFQNYVSEFCPSNMARVASHKGFLCIYDHFNLADGCKRPLLIVCNPFKKEVVKVLPFDRNYDVNLMHMRMDDSGHFKLLLAGSSPQLPCHTEEYDSKTGSWELWKREHHPEISDLLFKELFFQNGAYFKEHLFCLSNAADSFEILMCDCKAKIWSRFQGPHVTIEASDVQLPVDPICIEEYGRILLLFSKKRIGELVYFFIHKLNLDDVGNVTCEEVMRRERSADGKAFLVYPSTSYIPTRDEINEVGGCVFAFSMDMDCKCEETLHIHELDCKGDTSWGPPMPIETPKKLVLRDSNWTYEEKHAFLLLFYEYLSILSSDKTPWQYISQGLWEWGAYDRLPRSCQGLWDSLYKIYKKVLKEFKSNGSINFDLGLNKICFDLIGQILALRANKRPNLVRKTRETKEKPGGGSEMQGRSLKKTKRAEFLDSANEAHLASDAGGSSAPAILISDSITLQPSDTSGNSLSTATAFTATTTQPIVAVGPSLSMVPLLDLTTMLVQPSTEHDGPLLSTVHLPLASTSTQPAIATGHVPFHATTCSPAELNNLGKGIEHGHTLCKSARGVSDYQKAMSALKQGNRQLTAFQQGELFKKTVTLGRLWEQLKTKNLHTGGMNFAFDPVIEFLQSHLVDSGLSGDDCFIMLKDSFETDILMSERYLQEELSDNRTT